MRHHRKSVVGNGVRKSSYKRFAEVRSPRERGSKGVKVLLVSQGESACSFQKASATIDEKNIRDVLQLALPFMPKRLDAHERKGTERDLFLCFPGLCGWARKWGALTSRLTTRGERTHFALWGVL